MKNQSLKKEFVVLLSLLLMATGVVGQVIPGLYLHHDQPYYISGDALRYASYAYDSETGKPDPYNRIVNVALVGPDHRYQDQILSEQGRGNGIFYLPDTIASGVYQLVAFVGRPNGSSNTVFKKHIQVLNEEDSSIEICEGVAGDEASDQKDQLPFLNARLARIQMNQGVYQPRAQVNLSVFLSEAAYGSISITKRKERTDSHVGIDQYISMNQVNDISGQSSADNANVYDSLRIKGTVFNTMTGEPLVKNTVTLSFPSQEELYFANTDEEGRIDMKVKKGYDQYVGIFHTFDNKVFHRLRFEPAALEKSNMKISYSPPCGNKATIGLPQQWIELIENGVISKAYEQTNNRSFTDEAEDYLSDLFDEEVVLDDYEKVENMKTVFNGIVPNVSITNSKQRQIKMYPKESTFSYKQLPLLYVDGHPTYDEKWVLALDPEQVESIGVIASSWKLAVFGKAGSSGIISIKSKTGDLVPPLSPNMLRLSGHSHYDTEPITLSPSADERSPVFGTLLYWDPEFEGKQGQNQLTLRAGDETGTFDIRFEGFFASGEPVSISAALKIAN